MDIHDLKYDYDSSEFKVSEDKFKVYGHENELLHKHILKTNKIFHVLEKSNIIDNYYDFFYNEKIISIDKKKFLELINTFIQYHDMGKLSFNFQINRLNTDNKTKKLNNNGENQLKILKKYEIDSFIEEFDLKHSLVGGLLFITYLFKENIEDNLVFLLFAYAIYGHHSNLKDIIKEENFVWGIKPSSDVTYNTFKIISEYIFKNSEKYNFNKYQKIQKNFADLLNNFDNNILSKLSFFYSYIYSLLISADVIASSYYDLNSNEIPLDQWNNRITPSLLSDMNNTFNNLQINKNNNIQINKNIESITEINSLRKAMLLESSQNLVNNLKSENPSKVFFLNMPTGSGKTNTSIRLALDLLNSEDIDRIFYIVPFINIIEQNYEIIKDSLNLSEENGEIRGLYSALETLLEGSNKEKLKYIMKDDFADIPVVCTTFVSFFNSIIKNKKRNKYKLASLTNSVVIIDEIQSLPLKNWNSLYYLINELAENYNTYFIIMSATLPDFNQLKIDKNTKFNYNICNLIKNPKKYFDHYLFDRTEIKEFKEINFDDENVLEEYLRNKIEENFKIKYNKGLIVLNTIKTSKLVYELLYFMKDELDFELDLLNGSLLSSKKKEIISKINSMNDSDKRYILVSTQSIEAGVDISFDFLIRDFTILDSIEQVRGRCNRSRELNKRFNKDNIKGNVYLINLKKENREIHSYIYKNEEKITRIKETKEIINEHLNYSHDDIMEYYTNLSKSINKLLDQKEEKFIQMDRDNITSWNMMKYSKLKKENGIHIIPKEENDYTFFIEKNIDILLSEFNMTKTIEEMNKTELKEVYNEHKIKFIFSLKEIEYLKKLNPEIITENTVSGKKILNQYKELLDKSKDIEHTKIIQREFTSILNKFIINIKLNNEEIRSKIYTECENIRYFKVISEEKVGENEESIYSENKGFNYEMDTTGLL